MRRVVRSRTYVAQLKAIIEDGAVTFGIATANRTLAHIDKNLTQHLAHFPGNKQADVRLGLVVSPISKTPFVVLYDYDDAELRV